MSSDLLPAPLIYAYPSSPALQLECGLGHGGSQTLKAVLLLVPVTVTVTRLVATTMSSTSSPTPSHPAPPGNLLQEPIVPPHQGLLFRVKPSSLLKSPIINRAKVRW